MTTTAPTRPPARRAPRKAAGGRRPPRAAIDPRIRARRVAVAREHGRRRLRWLLVAIGLLAIVTAAVGVALSPLLAVDRVTVVGAPTGRAADVRRAVAPERGEPLLLVDTSGIAARVEALPWVATADISRQLPDALVVTVIPRAPVAWTRTTNGAVLLVDRTGRVLESPAAPPPGLPEVRIGSVAPSARTVPTLAPRVAAALTPSVRAQVAAIEVAGGEATLVMATGLRARLGAPSDLAAKLRAVGAMLPVLAGRPGGDLDVRVPGAPVTGPPAAG